MYNSQVSYAASGHSVAFMKLRMNQEKCGYNLRGGVFSITLNNQKVIAESPRGGKV